MKSQNFLIILIICLFSGGMAAAQAWRIVFQPDESLDFYVAKNADGTFAMISAGNEDKNLFLRVTNDLGKHQRFYFNGRQYLEIDVPEGGYVALMSEDAGEKIQYVHASQKVERLKFTASEHFFKAANGDYSDVQLMGQRVSQKQPTNDDPAPVPEDTGGKIDESDNFGFDPNREMRSVDEINRQEENPEVLASGDDAVGNKEEVEAQEADYKEVNEKYEHKIEELTSRVDKLRKTIDALQGELDQCTVERKKLEIGNFKPKSIVAGISAGFFNMASNNEADTLEKITGVPTTFDLGLSFNNGRFHKAIMLSAGAMPVNMTPLSYKIQPVVGMKLLFMAKKYGISGSGVVNTDMSYMAARAGFGVWVMQNALMMVEAGYSAGNVNLLYTKQVAPTAAISLVYNFRKKAD